MRAHSSPHPVIADAGHGYDRFGLQASAVTRALRLIAPVYDHWFRVTSHGARHIPPRGAAILAANHSGLLPLDGAMIYTDVLRHTRRVPRPIADLFVARMPFLGTAFTRLGVVSGTRANVARLLESGELLLFFPEGTRGIAKPFRERYHLAGWRVGHAELALRFRAPVIPVAVIGAEEQWLPLARLPLHPFGAPFVPVPLNLVPLPVHYHIHYGAPIALHHLYGPDSADDPEVIREASRLVRNAVADLVSEGLAQRQGIFG
jgi:1-acyl-sn-glycerol-3-phosphate acyltransferase